MTKTKIALASLLAFGFATSAFASDASMGLKERDAYWQTQNVASGTQAYASAPLSIKPTGLTQAEQREFARVPFAEVSSH